MTDDNANYIAGNAIDAAKRGGRTALFTFVGIFLPSLFNFLNQVSDWAASSGAAEFPKTSVFVYTAVSAATAATSGLVSFLWNWLENSKDFAIFGAKQDLKS